MKHFFYFIFLLLGLCGVRVSAQIEPQYSQYMYNKLLFNPAYAGSKDAVEFNGLYRAQYLGIADKTTQTEYLGFNMPIYAISSGVGLTATNDNIGYLRTTAVNLDYDYRKKFSFGSVAVGVNIGFIQSSLQGALLRTPTGSYTGGSINQKDPDVPATTVSGIAPDFGLGLYLNNDRYFAGIAMDHLYSVISMKNVSIDYARDLIIMGGYDFLVGKHFSIMPSLLIKTDFKETQTDLSLTMKIYNNILTGIALRGYDAKSLDAVILYVGAQIKGFRLVYSYDINTSYLNGFNTGTHEISVAYDLRLLKKAAKTGYFYHNSRFL
jgi:type IX secretion system PorP/SprF family membrane protein